MADYRWDERGLTNWRDLGISLDGQGERGRIAHGVLFRCGLQSSHSTHWEDLGSPAVKLNLRPGPDDLPSMGPSVEENLKAPKDTERYDFSDERVQRWVFDVMRGIATAPSTPVLVHCKSGKDRTGVVMAAVCAAMGVSKRVVRDEFLLSTGGRSDLFDELTLPALFPATGACFFDRLPVEDLTRLRARLRPPASPAPSLPGPATRDRMLALLRALKARRDEIAAESVTALARDPAAAEIYTAYQALLSRHPQRHFQAAVLAHRGDRRLLRSIVQIWRHRA